MRSGLLAAQQAVIDEDAGELVADGAVDERGRHRRVHAAGEGADHLPVPTCSLMRSMLSLTKLPIVQLPWQPQTL